VTGHLPSIPIKQRRKSPSFQVILIVFVALFILFLWLNFVLAQEIESIGREIQVKTEELDTVERRHEALMKEISARGAQQEMATRASVLGYQPQTPVYLAVSTPLVQASGNTLVGSAEFTAVSGGEQDWPSQPASSLLDVLARQLEVSETGDMP
jgi:predicted PurR-regulated permease PerM